MDRTRRRLWAPCCAVTLLWLLWLCAIAPADDRRAMPGSIPSRARIAPLLGRAAPHEAVPLSITLQLQHGAELAALIAAQQDPATPEYHRWLTPDEFRARFAPPPDTYAALVQWLEQQGFVVRTWPNGLRIDFSGRVAGVEGAFGVRLNRYDDRGRSPVASEDAPLLPARFADSVSLVRLDTFPLAEPLVRVLGAGRSLDAMGPRDMYLAYNLQPLLDRGINGSGQIIAVVARSDFSLSDVRQFQERYGVPVRDPLKVFPASNPGVGATNGVCQGIRNDRQLQNCIAEELGEVLLDAQWAGAMAPGASVLVDIGDSDIDVSLMDIVNHHTEAKMVTMSFGSCERLDAGSLAVFAPLYAQAATQGQTVLVSTGDDGADGCQDGRERSVNVLASDVNVTAVGGTALNPDFDAAGDATRYVSEVVWNDTSGASGGGASILVHKPAYQSAPGVPADGFRDQPDVALLASPQSPGYVTVFEGQTQIIGGTSAGAPSWAGIVALLNQTAGTDGLGPLNARLYQLGRQQYAGSGPAVFHDVTAGDTTFNGVAGTNATVGFDLATGLGTPDVAVLAQTFAPCPGDCNGDATVSVDELVIAVDIALGATPLAQCTALDTNGDSAVTVDEVLAATNRALNGC